LLSPEYVTPIAYEPTPYPAKPPAVGEVTGVVVQAPPLMVHAIVPVAPAGSPAAVQRVVWGPKVIGFGEQETFTLDGAETIVSVVDALADV
jgi:hypothetical protein